MNAAVRMTGCCWEVTFDPAPDGGWPHCATEQEARTLVDERDDVMVTSLSCESGCEPAGLDPWVPSTVGMEPIPGIEAVS